MRFKIDAIKLSGAKFVVGFDTLIFWC